MRKLFWFLVVLAVLAVGADRGLHLVAERTLADRVQAKQQLKTAPEADIAGFPFLTQVYDGRFDQITVTEHDVPLGRIEIARLVLTFRDVTADRKFRSFEAANGTATARIPYAELSRVLGVQLRYAGNGTVRATKTVTVGGQTVRPSVSLRPEVIDGALSFASSPLAVPMTRLPFGIRPTALAAKPGAVVLTLSGKDLRYTR